MTTPNSSPTPPSKRPKKATLPRTEEHPKGADPKYDGISIETLAKTAEKGERPIIVEVHPRHLRLYAKGLKTAFRVNIYSLYLKLAQETAGESISIRKSTGNRVRRGLRGI